MESRIIEYLLNALDDATEQIARLKAELIEKDSALRDVNQIMNEIGIPATKICSFLIRDENFRGYVLCDTVIAQEGIAILPFVGSAYKTKDKK